MITKKMINKEIPLSGSAKKVEEYIDRIKGGESKDSIVQGLPPSFVRSIEAGLTSNDDSKINQERIESIRKKLGISSAEKNNNQDVLNLVLSVTKDRKQAVVDLYENLFKNIDDPEHRRQLVSGLFQDVYNKYRLADYPENPNEEKVWEYALKSNKVEIDDNQNGWMYRGIFPKNGEKTVTRGSFNVNVTPELIDALDESISSGRIKANYKFGRSGTAASPVERHDSISIYFFEQPDEKTIQELSRIIKPYVRGDNLLGHKIADGFFMSEVGSIQSKQVEDLIDLMNTKDKAFAEAIKTYTTPRLGTGTSLKMSEAQFYAIKDVAKAFGYNLNYNNESGFEIKG